MSKNYKEKTMRFHIYKVSLHNLLILRKNLTMSTLSKFKEMS